MFPMAAKRKKQNRKTAAQRPIPEKRLTKRKSPATGKSPTTRRSAGAKQPPATTPTDSPSEESAAAVAAGPLQFPVVAIGASAGGLDAFKRFFRNMPANSGAAFVLVPHLDPTHRSLMVELLARQTQMHVCEAEEGMTIQANSVYVIPPNKDLAISNGLLQLSAPSKPRGLETAIDFCFRSVAADQQEKAIAIVLSGTGSHGTLGLKEIKLSGGMVMVQEPESAEYDQMPRNAIATGQVDYILPPELMPDALMKFMQHPYLNKMHHQATAPQTETQQLSGVLAVLKTRTKYDFRCYRKSMLMRRVQRRMGLCQIHEMPEYLDYLRENADEVTALYKDLLIGVTAFFREVEAFHVLGQRVVPKLIERACGDGPIRIWIPGCATGEEAYSLAMLLIEQFSEANKPPNIQIFATDIDEESLETARNGRYPDSIAADLSPERLQRFFSKTDEHRYQANKQLREAIVFAPQNLISDAPFSKLDLVSCRNLLIYLDPDVQAKIIRLFHFALVEDGYLLLGPSESIGRQADLFEPVSKKCRVYRRIGPIRHNLLDIPIVAIDKRRAAIYRAEPTPVPPIGFAELTQKMLLEGYAPAAVLINRKFEILFFYGPTGSYVEPPTGEPTNDLLAMARQGLRTKIRAACHGAIRDGQTVTDIVARVKRNGSYIHCTITVRPIVEPKEAEGLMLITFQDRDTGTSPQRKKGGKDPSLARRSTEQNEESKLVQQLEYELNTTREDLQSTIEEMESSNEEQKAANEEIMSMNEELQSANEELETSKEELQSLNEELSTVNSELRDKLDELETANNDIMNLMTSTNIPTVFLDTKLAIARFTPATSRLFSVTATDVGRPLRDFATKFNDVTLLDDCRQVLERLTPIEKDLTTDDGRSYSRRIVPYRTADNRIEGVVVTFVDISERKRAVDAVTEARRYSEAIVETVHNPLLVLDGEFRVQNCNAAFYEMFKARPEETAGRMLFELPSGQWNIPALRSLLEDVLPKKHVVTDFQVTQQIGQSGDRTMLLNARLLAREGQLPDQILLNIEDVTDRLKAKEKLRALNEELEQRVDARTADLKRRTDQLATSSDKLRKSGQRIRAIVNTAADAIVTIGEDGKMQTVNPAAERMFGYTADEMREMTVNALMPSPYREQYDGCIAAYIRTRDPEIVGNNREILGRDKDGRTFPIELTISEHHDGTDWMFTGFIRDTSERKQLQREVLGIAEDEQRRIGQDLHDSVQQELAGLGMLAQTLLRNLAKEPSELEAAGAPQPHDLLAKIVNGITRTHQEVQTISRGMVPMMLDQEGFMDALRELAAKTDGLSGVSCAFKCEQPVDIEDSLTATHLYRIAQEATTNALKHGQPEHILIALEGDDGQPILRIADDGAGLDPAEVSRAAEQSRGLGLKTMSYRASLIGASLTVKPVETGGTLVTCRFPGRIQHDD
jgi:two-component system CheB/CheR fusion protein